MAIQQLGTAIVDIYTAFEQDHLEKVLAEIYH